MRENSYSMHRALPGTGMDEAIERATVALQREGFGVLTSIDVKSTLEAKLGVDFRPYVILGACNPALAHRALGEDDNIGLLLPCNVVIAATDDGVEVAVVRPHTMMDVADNPAIHAVAEEAQARLERFLQAL
jgi:uncharacterized protein (DUF302 family)